MCGRFAVTTDPKLLAEKIQAIDEVNAKDAGGPNYNVAPTTKIATLVSRHDEPDDDPTRRLRLMRWGLVPPWAKAGEDGEPEKKAPQPINARSDKVLSSGMFKSAAKSKRCLIPMTGWYEWRKNEAEQGKKARKTPFFMTPGDDDLVLMAGLWSVWRPKDAAKDEPPLLTATIITTDAVGPLTEVHDRMPLIVAEKDWDRWLNPDEPLDPDMLDVHSDLSKLEIREISTLVNNVRNNGPELLVPAEEQTLI